MDKVVVSRSGGNADGSETIGRDMISKDDK